jgi:hypothetical protein
MTDRLEINIPILLPVVSVAAAYLFGDVRPVADLAAVAVNGRQYRVQGGQAGPSMPSCGAARPSLQPPVPPS